MARENQYRRSPFAGILGILFILLLLYVIFKMVFGAISLVWGILAFAAPILLIASMFLNFNVVKQYGNGLVDAFKKDTTRGILYSLATVIGYPVVSLYLFYKSLTTRQKIKKAEERVKNKKSDEDYVDFEEVEDDDFLVLEDLEEETPEQEPLNRYDDLFSDQ